ncbi:MAG: hypothetical protein JXD18_05380, partial [Anaerolineae bacterium]|nr:hypothetical protein [Anaerolineae bacterium]
MKKNVWRKIWISIGTTAALVFLIWATSTTLAQGPDDPEVSPSLPLHTPPESATAPMEPEGGPNETMKFTYQGLLEIDGHPVTGNYLFWGAMYDAKTAGVFQGYCTESGSDTAFESYVEDGVFTLYLICGGWNSDAFTGAGRWLDLWVAPAGTSNWVRLTESLQPISPTPYAFSLFPGAIINGTSFGGDFGDSVLNIYNNNTVSTWSAFRAETASGSAVRGTSDS